MRLSTPLWAMLDRTAVLIAAHSTSMSSRVCRSCALSFTVARRRDGPGIIACKLWQHSAARVWHTSASCGEGSVLRTGRQRQSRRGASSALHRHTAQDALMLRLGCSPRRPAASAQRCSVRSERQKGVQRQESKEAQRRTIKRPPPRILRPPLALRHAMLRAPRLGGRREGNPQWAPRLPSLQGAGGHLEASWCCGRGP